MQYNQNRAKHRNII